MYTHSMFRAKIQKKILYFFHPKINIFTAVKYCCILQGHVFVMNKIFSGCGTQFVVGKQCPGKFSPARS